MSSEDPWARMRELEGAMRSTTVQRQALQAQLGEAEHALAALPEAGDAWRIIGNIMVKRDATTVRAELIGRRDALRSRVDAVTAQEKDLRGKLDALQREVVKGDV